MKTKCVLAHVVPYKGGGVEWVIDQLEKGLRKFGIHGKVILNSDQENAILDVLKDLAKSRAKDGLQETIIESSPQGESQSNGIAERAVQDIENGVCIHKFDFESKLGATVPLEGAVVPWLVEHVADMIDKERIGVDGKTAY